MQVLLEVSHAILRVQTLNEVLEVIAEGSRVALNAASVSISRWERCRGVLRTLINVGELGPGEERWPRDEEYPLADHRYASELLRHGRSYVNSIDNLDADPVALGLLHRLNKESELAVPLMVESMMWGEIWATGTRGRRFGPDDERLLEAIAAHTSAAINRAEQLGDVSRHAYTDPLTGLANRRGLELCLGDLEDRQVALTILVCDLDRLREVQDRAGHGAGAALIRGVAGALSDVASEYRASLVARIDGDAFCVILSDGSLASAEDFACAASRQITRDLGPDASLCWGAAAPSPEHQCCAGDLIALPAAALLEARRLGPARLRLRVPGDDGCLARIPDRRGEYAAVGRRVSDELIRRFVDQLCRHQPATTLAALELLACELTAALNAAAWSISATTDDLAGIRTVVGVESELDPE